MERELFMALSLKGVDVNQQFNSYLLKKTVDWSLLHQGTGIRLTFQNAFNSTTHQYLKRGQKREIFIVINGKSYSANLINQLFAQDKYQGHSDILQIRYNPRSELATDLRKIFFRSYEYLKQQRVAAKELGSKKQPKLPEHMNEQVAIYLTNAPNTYWIECITEDEFEVLKDTLKNETEQHYEESIDYGELRDDKAGVYMTDRIVKFRRLNRAIGTSLKELYSYKCQICGKNFTSPYGAEIAESHHIEPFLVSLNNDALNQIILCPNHHRIIHKAQPEFKRSQLMFVYPNGFGEKLMINQHL